MSTTRTAGSKRVQRAAAPWSECNLRQNASKPESSGTWRASDSDCRLMSSWSCCLPSAVSLQGPNRQQRKARSHMLRKPLSEKGAQSRPKSTTCRWPSAATTMLSGLTFLKTSLWRRHRQSIFTSAAPCPPRYGAPATKGLLSTRGETTTAPPSGWPSPRLPDAMCAKESGTRSRNTFHATSPCLKTVPSAPQPTSSHSGPAAATASERWPKLAFRCSSRMMRCGLGTQSASWLASSSTAVKTSSHFSSSKTSSSSSSKSPSPGSLVVSTQ
mmetsp:Transcript_40093/g.118859  ORF Transcript_40093/g.118859 Transcript_40093/m.118859 type:complete len:271 (-) Transcript_40093:310-1122(-)